LTWKTGVVALIWALIPPIALAQTTERANLWVMWERLATSDSAPQFRSHVMLNVPPEQAQTFFNNLAPSAQQYGMANVAHAKSPLCLTQEKHDEPRVIDVTGLELAEKETTLRGLNGVFVDFRAVRGPRTFTGDFGTTVHDYVVAAFQQSGIPLLTKDQIDQIPGRPTLSLRYSDEIGGCRPWSISLGLKQTTVLSRDTAILLEATTWSASTRQSEDDIDYNALNALRDAVTLFIADYAKANSVTGVNAVTQLAPAN
jgi:hypothetical protein